MGSFSSKDKQTVRVVQIKETTLEVQGKRMSPKAKRNRKDEKNESKQQASRRTKKDGGKNSKENDISDAVVPFKEEDSDKYSEEIINKAPPVRQNSGRLIDWLIDW